MTLYNIKTERGLFINRSMQKREVLLNILLDPHQNIQLRLHNPNQERHENWNDWRFFSEIEESIHTIRQSPKVPYSYGLGSYTPQGENYDSGIPRAAKKGSGPAIVKPKKDHRSFHM